MLGKTTVTIDVYLDLDGGKSGFILQTLLDILNSQVS
jgi:hypothetical protein